MFLTKPPCKALGVYSDADMGNLTLLTRILDADGIRIRQFLSELEEHSTAAVDM